MCLIKAAVTTLPVMWNILVVKSYRHISSTIHAVQYTLEMYRCYFVWRFNARRRNCSFEGNVESVPIGRHTVQLSHHRKQRNINSTPCCSYDDNNANNWFRHSPLFLHLLASLRWHKRFLSPLLIKNVVTSRDNKYLFMDSTTFRVRSICICCLKHLLVIKWMP